jgi:hypothetical protein
MAVLDLAPAEHLSSRGAGDAAAGKDSVISAGSLVTDPRTQLRSASASINPEEVEGGRISVDR